MKSCPYCGDTKKQARFIEQGTMFDSNDVAVAKYTNEYYYCRYCNKRHHISGAGFTIRDS